MRYRNKQQRVPSIAHDDRIQLDLALFVLEGRQMEQAPPDRETAVLRLGLGTLHMRGAEEREPTSKRVGDATGQDLTDSRAKGGRIRCRLEGDEVNETV